MNSWHDIKTRKGYVSLKGVPPLAEGATEMAKSVKLVAENDLGVRVEIGRADLETVGSERMVILTVVNPNLIRLLGGTKVTGILTNFTEPEEPEEGTDEEVPQ